MSWRVQAAAFVLAMIGMVLLKLVDLSVEAYCWSIIPVTYVALLIVLLYRNRIYYREKR